MERIYDTELYQKHKPSRAELKTEPMWLRLKFIRQNLSRAANRGSASQVINVTLDYMYKIGEQQKWKCALTGVPLEFERGGTNWGGKWCNPNSCTIDRIDSSRGYVTGNIQLITWRVNCMKRDIPNDEFVEICKQVAKKCR